jgi:hypothetical protein
MKRASPVDAVEGQLRSNCSTVSKLTPALDTQERKNAGRQNWNLAGWTLYRHRQRGGAESQWKELEISEKFALCRSCAFPKKTSQPWTTFQNRLSGGRKQQRPGSKE